MPTSSKIAAMGDKIESKKLAQKAGVNIVPGHLDDIATTDEAVKIAADIADHARVVAVVAAVGREIERDRQTLLPGGEVAAIEGVRILGG